MVECRRGTYEEKLRKVSKKIGKHKIIQKILQRMTRKKINSFILAEGIGIIPRSVHEFQETI